MEIEWLTKCVGSELNPGSEVQKGLSMEKRGEIVQNPNIHFSLIILLVLKCTKIPPI